MKENTCTFHELKNPLWYDIYILVFPRLIELRYYAPVYLCQALIEVSQKLKELRLRACVCVCVRVCVCVCLFCFTVKASPD